VYLRHALAKYIKKEGREWREKTQDNYGETKMIAECILERYRF